MYYVTLNFKNKNKKIRNYYGLTQRLNSKWARRWHLRPKSDFTAHIFPLMNSKLGIRRILSYHPIKDSQVVKGNPKSG